MKNKIRNAIKNYKDLVDGSAVQNAKIELDVQKQIGGKSITAAQNALDSHLKKLKESADNIRTDSDFLNRLKYKADYHYNLSQALLEAEQINKDKQRIKQAIQGLESARKKTNIAGAATVGGALALAGAGAYGLSKMKKKKEEKNAFDIVNESFEKIADVVDFNKAKLNKAKFNKATPNKATLSKRPAFTKPGSKKEAVNALRDMTAKGQISVKEYLDELSDVTGIKPGSSSNKSVNSNVVQFPNSKKKISASKGVALAGAGALALGAGAYGIHKLKKKKEEKEMNKNAFDIVNDRFEKIAGLKDVLTGKNIRTAINDVKGGKAVLNNFQKNLKHIEPGARQATKEAIGVMTKDLGRLKGRALKEGAKTVGAYATPIAAGAYGVNKLKKKQEEKTASEIVNEIFNNIASGQ